jgi:hypothetical protein
MKNVLLVLTLFVLFLLFSFNDDAYACSDESGDIVISSNCSNFDSTDAITSLTINSGVSVTNSAQAMVMAHIVVYL